MESSINDVTVLGGKGSRILWRQIKGLSNKTRDNGRGGPKLSKIVWRHLWMSPMSNFTEQLFSYNEQIKFVLNNGTNLEYAFNEFCSEC